MKSLVALAALFLALAPLASRAEPILVRDVRYWSHPKYTRVVVEFSARVAARVHQLDKPARLYMDFEGVQAAKFAKSITVEDGLLRRVRMAQNTPGRARLVVDLERYGRHRLFTLPGPDRVVLDVYDTAKAKSEAKQSAGVSPSAPERPVTVVLDPGHGGRDPGAVGIGGLREKDLTLSVALDLQHRLRARGFRVVMTRSTDETLSLEERTALAEGVGGDVFISLHANAAERSAHGVETYYLDTSHEGHTLRLAARESGVTPQQVDALDREVARLRLSDTAHSSIALANGVHRSIIAEVQQVFRSVRDLGVKQGPFQVLFLSSAPSVLIEMGFVTNPRDARRLKRRIYQQVVAEQIARALSDYRRTQLRVGRPG